MSMDIAEYKKIVVALRPSLLSAARRIIGNAQDAEDIVQDVCLKIWHRRDQFDQYRNIEAYSITMVKNLSIDKIRSRHPETSDVELINQPTEELPDSILEEKDNNDAIRRIIKMLPPLQQRILQMKELDGYETDEIAEITGIAPNAIHNNLSRARKRLRELFLLYYKTKQATT